MASKRPVICLDLGGPARQVTQETGIKVAAHTPEQTVKDLAKAMQCLAKDPDLRLKLGLTGYKKVQSEFNWDSIGLALCEACRTVLKADREARILVL
jgi:glycosyltransferase involved in cell wall biosynthesis